jgi:hypothetical protein
VPGGSLVVGSPDAFRVFDTVDGEQVVGVKCGQHDASLMVVGV